MVDVVGLRDSYVAAHVAELGEVLQAQAAVVLSIWEQLDDPLSVQAIFDRSRWDRELFDRWFVRSKLTAADFGFLQSAELGSSFDPAALDDYIAVSSGFGVDNVNASTEEALQAALVDLDDPGRAVRDVFGLLLGARLGQIAAGAVTTSSTFGTLKAAEQANVKHKVWRARPGPASRHRALNGDRAEIGEPFSNGMYHPGDWRGGAENVSNCRCSLRFED